MIQTQEKYYNQLKKNLLDFFSNKKNVKIFLFGSSIRENKFGDIDVGIMGEVKEMDVRKLKEYFEESTFPFLVDIINFNNVDEPFKQNVLSNQITWIKP
ncbi:hypothetical protein COY05_00695 [Candidatus Peregrinibacteria bacterium CG_4_10_14_0_2_um_filter_38_24]|nr:MAG: hypothetical protein COY05_00695 [Candidatus Peregrinibacteria bacterium CG_4_10_14_0_2_um_filter_38_24]